MMITTAGATTEGKKNYSIHILLVGWWLLLLQPQ